MNKIIIVLICCLATIASLRAQEDADVIENYVFGRAVSSDTLSADDERNLVYAGDSMPSGRFINPVKFTRKELNKVKDPRVSDLFWYALNDTTDQVRYLQAHYAFNRLRDNWSVFFGGGVQTVVLDGLDNTFDLGPQFELGFKKDVHPYWSVRGLVQLSTYKCDVWTAHLSTFIDNMDDVPSDLRDWTQHLSYSTATLRFDAMLDILNLCAGRELLYNPFDFYAYAGPGFAYSTHKWGQRGGSCFIPFWSVGAIVMANLTQRWSLYLDLNASWQGDDLEGYSEQCSAYKFAGMFGAAYKFTKVQHFQRLGYDDSDLRNQLNDAYQEGDKLASYIQNAKQDTVINLPADLIQAAFFQIDRIELAHAYVLNLGFYADLIKQCPTQKFLVRGFADLEVGPASRNAWLCEKRAQVVADVLTKTYGVDPDQLIVGGGDLNIDLPFLRENGHHRFNRCTIVAPLTKDYKFIKADHYEDNSELMDGRVKSNIKKNY